MLANNSIKFKRTLNAKFPDFGCMHILFFYTSMHMGFLLLNCSLHIQLTYPFRLLQVWKQQHNNHFAVIVFDDLTAVLAHECYMHRSVVNL